MNKNIIASVAILLTSIAVPARVQLLSAPLRSGEVAGDEDVSSVVMSFEEMVKANLKAQQYKAGSSLEAMYNIPIYALFDSYNSTGTAGAQNYYVIPGLKNTAFLNYTTGGVQGSTTFTWTDDDAKSPLEYTLTDYGATTVGWGLHNSPILTASTDGQTSTYQYHYTKLGDDLTYVDVPAYAMFGIDELSNLENANPWFGFSSTFVSQGQQLSYTSKQEFNNTGKKLTGFAEYYPAIPAHTYAEGIFIFTEVSDLSDKTKPLDGKTLTATIYTSDTNGNKTAFAKALATDADVSFIRATAGTFAYINYKFVNEDSEKAPVVLPKSDIWVVLDGFDGLSATYRADFAHANGYVGYGYAVLEDGSYSTLGYRNAAAVPRFNLHIGFSNAAMPTAELVDDVMNFSDAGGFGTPASDNSGSHDAIVQTALADWSVTSKPDWISSVAIDNSNVATEKKVLVSPQADVLPAGTVGRIGDIVLTSDFMKTVTLKVRQGDALSVAGTVVDRAEKGNNNIYNLNGQRVNNDFKGLVIQNGRKFINK